MRHYKSAGSMSKQHRYDLCSVLKSASRKAGHEVFQLTHGDARWQGGVIFGYTGAKGPGGVVGRSLGGDVG